MIGTILVNIYGIKLGLDVGTEMLSLDVYIDGSTDCNLEVLFIEGSLGSTDDKVIGSDEGIKLVSTDGKLLGTIIGHLYGIKIGLDVGTDMVSLNGSFGGSNYGKLEVLFLVESLGYTGGKLLGSDEGIKLGLFEGKVLVNILGNVDGITHGIYVGKEMGYLD